MVEDSLTMRRYLRSALADDPRVEVVGEATDGREAVELCRRLRPDVVTMDIVLPVMSGLSAIEQIMADFPTPILVVSSADRAEVRSTYAALAAGAVDVLEKPLGDASDDSWPQRLRSAVTLVSRIRVIAHPRARLDANRRPAPVSVQATNRSTSHQVRVVTVGASTGGPGAVIQLLHALPADYQVPILLVQHISAPEPFAVAFADWLGDQTGRRVAYGRDGVPVDSLAGRVVMAPPDRHLLVADGVIRLSVGPPRHSCRPSVDTLFESVAAEYGPDAAGCLLTGMGRDGAAGLLALRRGGARTFAQDQATSVVYGMPREAVLLGAAEQVLSPGQIGDQLALLHQTGRPAGGG